MRADQLHLELREGDAHANLVVGVAQQEDGEAGGQRILARCCQAAGHANHIALRDAYVEEALRKRLPEIVGSRGVANVAVNNDDVRVFVTKITQRFPKSISSWRSILQVDTLANIHAAISLLLYMAYSSSNSCRAPSSSSGDSGSP